VRALVTGCAGFIGSHLSESLLSSGTEVVGVDCFNDNYGRPVKLANLDRVNEWDAFDFVPLDLARGDLDDIVEEVDVIFHLAAEPGVRSSWGTRFATFERNNVLATQHLLEAARKTPELLFVNASSSSVYGHAEQYPTSEETLPRPFSPYGVTKLAAEHLCSLYAENVGLRVISLRLFSVFGPRQRPDMAFTRFCFAALTGQQITIYGDGRQVRDFTYVEDVVAALRAASTSDAAIGQVYNIGGGSEISLRETLDLLAELSGSELDITYTAGEHGDVRRTGADISRARRDLGFEPETTVPEGLALQLAWANEVLAKRGKVLQGIQRGA
jgi:UDP-glucuronate 4-epimerase